VPTRRGDKNQTRGLLRNFKDPFGTRKRERSLLKPVDDTGSAGERGRSTVGTVSMRISTKGGREYKREVAVRRHALF